MTNFYRIARAEIFLSNGQPVHTAPAQPGFHGRIVIENLRMAFSVQKNNSPNTNSCSLRIWNIKTEIRNRLRDYGDLLNLYVGYQNEQELPVAYTGSTANTEILFIGNTTNVRHVYDYPDIITILECGDGENFLNNDLQQLSFAPGTPARQVLKHLAENAIPELKISEFSFTPNTPYQTGFSYAGTSRDSLEKICAYLKVQWSIQNGKLQIIPINGTTIKPPFNINADTGMIGVPERYTYKGFDLLRNGRNTGWRVRATLKPSIVAGDSIRLSSTHLNLSPGYYRVETIRHEGDTFGAQWNSNIEVTLLLNPQFAVPTGLE